GGLMGMLPGVAKMKNQIASANLDDKVFKRQVAIINSMTPKERRAPKLLDASRKRRIAAGSGTKVEEINRLLKMHRQMADVMKSLGGAAGKRGPLAGLAGMMGFGGGGPSPEMLKDMADKMGAGGPGGAGGMGGLPPNFPGLPGGLPSKFPGGLPGLPKGLPGLGGSKKK
ncbi:signal recognition particle protein, partial [Xanthobacter autotrophicus]|nr:signal recognition particle protein [Xanthobacter autotrophicus]